MKKQPPRPSLLKYADGKLAVGFDGFMHRAIIDAERFPEEAAHLLRHIADLLAAGHDIPPSARQWLSQRLIEAADHPQHASRALRLTRKRGDRSLTGDELSKRLERVAICCVVFNITVSEAAQRCAEKVSENADASAWRKLVSQNREQFELELYLVRAKLAGEGMEYVRKRYPYLLPND